FAARRPCTSASGPIHAANVEMSGTSAFTRAEMGASGAGTQPLALLTSSAVPSPWIRPTRVPTTSTLARAWPCTTSARSVSSLRPRSSSGLPTRTSPERRWNSTLPSKLCAACTFQLPATTRFEAGALPSRSERASVRTSTPGVVPSTSSVAGVQRVTWKRASPQSPRSVAQLDAPRRGRERDRLHEREGARPAEGERFDAAVPRERGRALVEPARERRLQARIARHLQVEPQRVRRARSLEARAHGLCERRRRILLAERDAVRDERRIDAARGARARL